MILFNYFNNLKIASNHLIRLNGTHKSRSFFQISKVPFSVTQNEINHQIDSQYHFTINNGRGKLTSKQRDFYEKNGYLLIRNLLSDEDINLYLQRFQDLASGKIKPASLLTLQREKAVSKSEIKETTLYKVQELYADEVFYQYCKHPNVLDIVEAFVGPNIIAIHSMLINKPPDFGTQSSRHPLHQDLHYFPTRPADRIVGTWAALEKVTRDNGCLCAIPGTHLNGHLPHDYPDWEGGVNKLYYGINASPEFIEQRIHLEMERGDCLFFHPLLIHGSGINRTKGFRKAISCHFASADCHYIDVNNTIQEKLANEVMELFRSQLKKNGVDDIPDLSYKELWKIRARLVRGTSEEDYDG